MWHRELREASESFTELFFPSVQAQLVGEIGQSFSTICIIISKEASVFVRLFPPVQHPATGLPAAEAPVVCPTFMFASI